MSEDTQADAPTMQVEDNTPAETAPAEDTDNKEESATTESEVQVETKPTDYGIDDDPEAGVDWKQRYSDSQKEFQTKYKPLEENYNYFDSLVKDDPILARQVQDAVSRKRTVAPQPYGDIDQIVDRKLEERLEPVRGLIAKQEEEQRQARTGDVHSFEKKYGSELFKNAKNNDEIASIRRELGATALALHKEKRAKSFSEALEKAMILEHPEILIRKGESKALAGKASTEQASFSQDTSDSIKGKVADDMTPAQREWLAQMGSEYVK